MSDINIYIHTHIHTHTHTHIHTYIYIYTHTYTHAYKHTYPPHLQKNINNKKTTTTTKNNPGTPLNYLLLVSVYLPPCICICNPLKIQILPLSICCSLILYWLSIGSGVARVFFR